MTAVAPYPVGPDTEWAFQRYEQVRHRMPAPDFPATSVSAHDLGEVAGHFDAFILDAFGVLNIGATAIAGACEAMANLRRLGKQLCVLTNGATQTRQQSLDKYNSLGFDFSPHELVSSRDVAANSLASIQADIIWAAAAGPGDDFSDIPATVIDLIDQPDAFARAGGFLFLSSARWTSLLQQQWLDSLRQNPRPVVVANPDLVAPRETHLSLEPGCYANAMADELGLSVRFFGKPYSEVFEVVMSRWPHIQPERIAMVGDTLHTDVLGAHAAGIKSILVSDHGLFAAHDLQTFISSSGITPDFIVATP